MMKLSRLRNITYYVRDSRECFRFLCGSPSSSFSTSNFQKSDSIARSSPSVSLPRTRLLFPGSSNAQQLLRKPRFHDFSLIPCYYVHTRSFFFNSKGNTAPEASTTIPSPPSPPSVDPPKEDAQFLTKELVDAANNAAISLRETFISSTTWIHETVEQVLRVLRDALGYPEYTTETATQFLYTTIAALLVWLVMPRVFRMLHRYFEDGSSLILRRSERIPYEVSFWSALENPTKVFVAVVAFSQLGSLVAPTTIASQYLYQIWKGSAVISLVWFLHQWKSSVFRRVLAAQNLGSTEREFFHTVEKISSIGLLILGGMGVAETCGVAVQSILTVGGLGGVATAFAARDILGNMLSGFALQLMKPFSIGDTIKAGNVEGQVVDIGVTSTRLLDLDKFPVTVPNSFFSSQAIVNKSRATWRSFTLKIPIQLTDFEKVPQITEEVKNMLKSHPNVTFQNGVPLCHASRISGSVLEISVLCNLTFKGREDLLSSQQDITLQTLKIISNTGK
ncbi:hypothetical protein KP509_31G030700 [Ceratopteris richardii]|uniref:Mechanosensitive ion channel MscS domain-containing protein n=1 Tax=Ceratopteris richardii TaxID=49495 RepID=A0A8T2QWR9_CERRI|nr:hypothetical protein KP509_31G030700 [Ceratopteris richardii]